MNRNVAGSRGKYLARLRGVVEEVHECAAVWRESVPVHVRSRGKTAWKGNVEVFEITGHPTAKRIYAWWEVGSANDSCDSFVAILEDPPLVKDAKSAVKGALLVQSRREQRN